MQLRIYHVCQVMRHGERTPLHKETYPKDPYNESTYEPWGIGQLTNVSNMHINSI